MRNDEKQKAGRVKRPMMLKKHLTASVNATLKKQITT